MKKLIFLFLSVLIFNISFAQQSEGDITTYINANIRLKPTLPSRTADAFDVLNISKASLLGSYSNPSWITSLSWSKITSTPTTLSGYGITDAQSLLVSGTNIKTVGGTSILGSGDVPLPFWALTGTSTLTDNTTITGTTRTLSFNTNSFTVNENGGGTFINSRGGGTFIQSETGGIFIQSNVGFTGGGINIGRSINNAGGINIQDRNFLSFTSRDAAGTSRFNLLLDGINGDAIFTDGTASPKGLRYNASGYVTDARSLTDKGYVDAKVVDAINAGVTTIAPSENAVFDALALKQPLDADLTSIAGQSSTGVLRRTGSNTWDLNGIEDAVTNGVTDRAPTENAVFDVVATKVTIRANVFDANSSTYGCTPNNAGYDNALGIEKAIQDAWTYAKVNNSIAFVEFDDGEYYINRAVQTTSNAGNTGYYSQVPLPFEPYSTTAGYATVVIRPKNYSDYFSIVPVYFGNRQMGVTFRSTLTSQTFSSTYGWPSMFGGRDPKQGASYTSHVSFVNIEWHNITFKVPETPTIACVQDNLIAKERFKNVAGIIHKSVPTNPTSQPTSPLGVFNFGPQYNNNTYTLEGYNIAIGLYAGFAITEHTIQTGIAATADCYVGLKLSAPAWSGGQGFFHDAQLTNVSTEGFVYGIAATDENGVSEVTSGGNTVSGFSSASPKIGLVIDMWDIEEGGNATWNAAVKYHIYDPSDVLSGTITYGRAKYNVGSLGTNDPNHSGLSISGGTYLKLTNILNNGGQSVSVQDKFDRANSTSSLGSTDIPGTSWTAQTGTWGIISNRAYCQSAVASGATTINRAIVASGISDLIMTCDMMISGATPDIGLIYRYTDSNNYWLIDVNQANIGLYKKASGTTTQVGSLYTATIPKDVWLPIKVIATGSSHTIYLGGVSIVTGTDSFNSTAQTVGLIVVSGASLSSNAQRFNNFEVNSVPDGGIYSISSGVTGFNTTIPQSHTWTGNGLFSKQGVSASFGSAASATAIGTETVQIREDLNQTTYPLINNASNGSLSAAAVALRAGAANSNDVLALMALAPGYTPNGMMQAAKGIIRAENLSGLNIGTPISTPIQWWTNNAYRGQINSSGQFGIGSGTTSFTSTEKLLIREDQNALTYGLIANTTNNTAASSMFFVTSGDAGFNNAAVLRHLSPNFTTSGILQAGKAVFYGTVPTNIGTSTNDPVQFWSNNTLRGQFPSGGGLVIGTSSLSADAILEAQSTTKGFRPPTMTTTQRNAISSPTTALIVGNSTTNTIDWYNGTTWAALGALGGGLGGSTGSTDNAVLRADETGGGTAQASNISISDPVSSNVTIGTIGSNHLTLLPGGGGLNYIKRQPSGASNVTWPVLDISSEYNGTVTTGFGGSITFDAQIPAGGTINAGTIEWKSTDLTASAEKFDLIITPHQGTTKIEATDVGVQIRGSATNNSAAAGFVGEEINSAVSTYTNYTTTATYQNIVSITLTPGDWDLSAFFTYSSNSATITAASNAIFVISTTTASASGATEGMNISYVPQAALLGTSKFSDGITPYRVSISSTTTYYLNSQATFTVGNPQYVGSIRARRIR